MVSAIHRTFHSTTILPLCMQPNNTYILIHICIVYKTLSLSLTPNPRWNKEIHVLCTFMNFHCIFYIIAECIIENEKRKSWNKCRNRRKNCSRLILTPRLIIITPLANGKCLRSTKPNVQLCNRKKITQVSFMPHFHTMSIAMRTNCFY